MRFMQIESVLQTINRSEPAKNRFSVALVNTVCYSVYIIWTHYSMVKLLFCLYYLDALLNGKAAILPILFGRTTQW